MTTATVSNMRRYGGPGVVMVDSLGGEFSATPGDYFYMPDDEVLVDEAGEPCLLVIKHCEWIDVAEVAA